jgi:hypothetical protein
MEMYGRAREKKGITSGFMDRPESIVYPKKRPVV